MVELCKAIPAHPRQARTGGRDDIKKVPQLAGLLKLLIIRFGPSAELRDLDLNKVGEPAEPITAS